VRVLIVGRGRLGSSLARALRAQGAEVTHWPGRGRWSTRTARVELALLAVADPFLEPAARRLAAHLDARCPVLHASGARDASGLSALAPRPLGVFHPLVSFADRRAPALAGAIVVIAGDRAAVRAARRLARILALEPLEAPLHGPRYHAAAALVANGAAALAMRAVRSLEGQGVRSRTAERAVAGLLRSVADNVARVGVPAALTGPIVRGDAATVAAHRRAIDARMRTAYDALAPVILEVAREAGLPPSRARAVAAELGPITRAGSTRRMRAT
jgi:predicted short-subunit dehydrogenase-like oxidoreductase (DUF2520 family)